MEWALYTLQLLFKTSIQFKLSVELYSEKTVLLLLDYADGKYLCVFSYFPEKLTFCPL